MKQKMVAPTAKLNLSKLETYWRRLYCGNRKK